MKALCWYGRRDVRVETVDDPKLLNPREALKACRKGGVVSVPGAYARFVDKFPLGAFMEKGLTLRTGQTHVHRYIDRLLDHIQSGHLDPSVVVSHRLRLSEAPRGYELFDQDQDGCIKVVLRP